MWKNEAIWVAQEISSLFPSKPRIKCLNLGSSTRKYREVDKPYIADNIMKPLGVYADIIHVDAKSGNGVDISGDFSNPEFRKSLGTDRYDLILCNNVLTHVNNIDHVFEIVNSCLADDGYLIVTAPNLYPYCADPFDYKYRPNQSDIEKKLPNLETVQFCEFESTDRHLDRLMKNRRLLLSFMFNIVVPRRGFRAWVNIVSDLPSINRNFKAIGLVMRRK